MEQLVKNESKPIRKAYAASIHEVKQGRKEQSAKHYKPLIGIVKKSTPVLELYIRLSWPVIEEKDIFKFPDPISMVSFCGLSITESPFLLFPA